MPPQAPFISPVPLLPHQQRFFDSRTKNLALITGVGAGKSFVGALKTALLSREAFPHPVLIATGSRDQLLRNIVFPLQNMAAELGFETVYKGYPYHRLSFTWPGETDENGAPRQGFGFAFGVQDDGAMHRMRGLNVAAAWVDEGRDVPVEAGEIIKSRVRVGEGLRQILLTSTPGRGADWMHRFFVRDVAEKPARARDRELITGVTSAHNPHLPADYLQDLRDSYDPTTLAREFQGQWVEDKTLQVVHEFDRARHAVTGEEQDYTPNLPVLLSLDFNMLGSALLCHWWEEKLWVFDEIRLPKSNTWEVVGEAVRRMATDLPAERRVREWVVAGDATGHHGDTRSRYNDWQIVREILRDKPAFPWTYHEATWTHNPSVRDTVVLLNAKFSRDEVLIHERCRLLMMDLEETRYRPGSETLDKTNPDLTHLTDALRYAAKAVYYNHPQKPSL